jgi:hypothetical protein
MGAGSLCVYPLDIVCGMVLNVGMTNTMTHPEDRPMTFVLTGRHTLDDTSPDFAWVLDDLREHDAIGEVLDRTASTPPWQIVFMRRGRIGIRINTSTAVFDLVKGDEPTYKLNVKRTLGRRWVIR